jgi:DNA adenine methylase
MAKKATRTEGKNANFDRVYAPIKVHGGKFYLAEKQLEYAPPRESYDTFIDACVASGSVVLAHDPTDKAEVVNDLDGVVSNFWYVLQDAVKFQELKIRLEQTPFSEVEYLKAKELLTVRQNNWNPVEMAAALFVLARQSRQALGKDFATITKNRLRRRMNEQVSSWLTAIDGLDLVHDRVKRFVVRSMPVVQLLKEWRTVKRAFFYIDPPYHPNTRTSKQVYRFEMTHEQHIEMLDELVKGKYMFMLCGYPTDLYAKYAKDNNWRTVVFPTDNKASGSKEKKIMQETIWMNY